MKLRNPVLSSRKLKDGGGTQFSEQYRDFKNVSMSAFDFRSRSSFARLSLKMSKSTKSRRSTKAKVPDELHIFLPAMRSVIWVLIVLGGMLAVSSYFTIVYGGLFWWGAALLLGLAVAFLAFPVLRNPRLLVSGEKLYLYSFGRRQAIDFSSHLVEVVERDGTIVSYRFNCEGKYFQISPGSYNDSDELQRQFKELMKTRKLNVSVMFR